MSVATFSQPSSESTERRGAAVEVVNLSKIYPHGGHSVPVLRNVNLSLKAGDMAAIVGASGVGKSTLLQVLGTLDLPTAGSIRFNGEEITRMSHARLAEFRNREIGFVFQFHHLLPEFTAIENVMMPALIRRIPRNQARRRAEAILRRVGLSHRLTHKPSELSGGEQQRVALARAMVMEPSLLLADEPTGNLDSRTGEEIHELFIELNRERGSTLLVVTHNPNLAAMMPRCLRMLDGGGLEERNTSPYRDSRISSVIEDEPASVPAVFASSNMDSDSDKHRDADPGDSHADAGDADAGDADADAGDADADRRDQS